MKNVHAKMTKSSTGLRLSADQVDYGLNQAPSMSLMWGLQTTVPGQDAHISLCHAVSVHPIVAAKGMAVPQLGLDAVGNVATLLACDGAGPVQ